MKELTVCKKSEMWLLITHSRCQSSLTFATRSVTTAFFIVSFPLRSCQLYRRVYSLRSIVMRYLILLIRTTLTKNNLSTLELYDHTEIYKLFEVKAETHWDFHNECFLKKENSHQLLCYTRAIAINTVTIILQKLSGPFRLLELQDTTTNHGKSSN